MNTSKGLRRRGLITQRRIFAGLFGLLALSVMLPVWFSGSGTAAKIIYVNQQAAGSNTGSSWTDAYTELEAALETARSGDQVWVAKGTYKPAPNGPQPQPFTLADGVRVYGGFSGAEVRRTQRDWETNVTKLSAHHLANGAAGNKSPPVVAAAGNAVLDGFSIAGSEDSLKGRGLATAHVTLTVVATYNLTVQSSGVTGVIVTSNILPEITDITTVADVAGSLDGTYFILYEPGPAGSVAFWFDVDDSGTAEPAHGAARSFEINTVATGNTANQVAAAANLVINADPSFSTGIAGNLITVTNALSGPINDGVAGTSGFTVVTTRHGEVNAGGTTVGGPPGQYVIIPSIDDDDLDAGDTTIQLIAPWASGGKNFVRWQYADGVFISTETDITITLTAHTTVVAVYGNIIYVNGGAPGPARDGTSWATAFTDLQDAFQVEKAAKAEDEIWVATGSYSPGVTELDSFTMAENMAVYGGFLSGQTQRNQRNWAVNVTTLDGGGLAFHVVIGADNAVLDGFTIRGGYAVGLAFPHNRGGGMANYVASPRIANCKFIGNYASMYGGAMHNFIASPTIVNCIFGTSLFLEYNEAGSRGGAMYNESNASPKISDCVFEENFIWWGVGGGAVYNFRSAPTFTDTDFIANYAVWSSGGAVYNSRTDSYNYDSPKFIRCDFDQNWATADVWINMAGNIMIMYEGFGGAVYNNAASPSFTDCNFLTNWTDRSGGAMANFNGSTATISGGQFDNSATRIRGGAIYNVGSAGAITDCDFTNSEAPYGAAIYNDDSGPILTRCDFINNIARENEILDYEGSSYLPIYDPTWPADPNFLPPIPSPTPSPILPKIVTMFGGKGGAIYNDDSAPVIIECNFDVNKAELHGGAIYHGRLQQSFDPDDITEPPEEAPHTSPATTDSIFTNNKAVEWGGAIYNGQNVNARITGCTFGGALAGNIAGPEATSEAWRRPANDFYSYNPGDQKYTKLANFPIGLRNHRLVTLNGIIYLVGGIRYSTSAAAIETSAMVFRYDGGWTQVASMITARSDFGCAASAVENRIYVFGGLDGGGFPLLTAEAYTPGGIWTPIASMPATRSEFNAATVALETAPGPPPTYTDYVYLAGGGTTAVWRYNTVGNSYSTVANTPGVLGYSGVAAVDNVVWVVNGTSAHALDTATFSWLAFSPDPQVGKDYKFALGYGGNYLVAFCGVEVDPFYVERVLPPAPPPPDPPAANWSATTDYPGRGWKQLAACTSGSGETVCVGGGLERDKDGFGGAIYNEYCAPAIAGSVFTENVAGPQPYSDGQGQGGAIYSTNSAPTIRDSHFQDNFARVQGRAHAQGGAVCNVRSDTVIARCTFDGNWTESSYPGNIDPDDEFVSHSHGGAVYNQAASATEGVVTVTDSTMTGNRCYDYGNDITAYGGGMYNETGPHIISGSTFGGSDWWGGTYPTGNYADHDGGGMYNASSVAVSHCHFSYNDAADDGGGMYNGNGPCEPTITDCTFDTNWAVSFGGGMTSVGATLPIISRSVFTNNTAAYGGGMGGWDGTIDNDKAELSVVDCTFRSNRAGYEGGGLWIDPGEVTTSLFEFNMAYNGISRGDGGGMLNRDAIITRCMIRENVAIRGGGAFSEMWFPDYINTVFWRNSAIAGGGLLNYGSLPWFFHCTLTENYGEWSGGGMLNETSNILFNNSIAWGNIAGFGDGELDSLNEIVSDNSVPTFQYSCVKGGREGVGMIGGNIDDDPMFVDSATGNMRLQATSPCINAGHVYIYTRFGANIPIDSDIDGNPHEWEPDIGAYESMGHVPDIVIKGNDREIANGDTTPSEADYTDFGFVPAYNGDAGTAQAGTLGTITLAATASIVPGAYDNMEIIITGGTGSGQTRVITTYSGPGWVATVDSNWATTPDATSVYDVRPFQTWTYTIHNLGIQQLNLTSVPLVVISGTDASDFSVVADPVTPIISGGTTTFQIKYRPAEGPLDVRNASVSIANNDTTANPYVFAIQGTAGEPIPEIELKGTDSLTIIDGDIEPITDDGTDFDLVLLSGTCVRTFTIHNFGGADLNLSGTPDRVVITGDDAADFSVVTMPAALVLPGEATNLEIAFSPSEVGIRIADVSIANDDPDEDPYDFAIQGTGHGPRIAVRGNGMDIDNGDATPSAVDNTAFGLVTAGESYTKTHSFSIESTGTSNLVLTANPMVSITGAHWSDFTVTAQPAVEITPGWVTTFDLKFQPSASGARTAIVNIANNDTAFSFTVQGNCPAGNIPPVAVADAYPNPTAVGATVTLSGSQSYDPDNAPVTPLTYLWSQISGPAAPAITPNPFAMDPTIIPPADGKYVFELEVDDGADTDTDRVTVWVGNAISLSIPATARECDGVLVNQGSVMIPSTATWVLAFPVLVNITSGDLSEIPHPGALWVTALDTPFYFSLTMLDDGAIDGDQTVTITATGGPGAPWNVISDTADIVVEDTNGPEIDVRGNGQTITDGDLTPDRDDHTNFGTVVAIGETVTRTFTVHNYGDAALNLSGAIISGPNAGDFSPVTEQPYTPVPGGGTTNFRVTFAPGPGMGVRYATITIANNDTNENPYSFAIQGTKGLAPEINVSGLGVSIPDGWEFPSVTDDTDFGIMSVGGTPVVHTFTIENIGDADLSLLGAPSPLVQLFGDQAADFAVTVQPTITTIPPSNSVTFEITFDVLGYGLRETTVVIPNNDADEDPYDFVIQGDGGPEPVTGMEVSGNAAWIQNGDTTPDLADHTDFGTVNPDGGTRSRTFTITNTGATPFDLTGTPDLVVISGVDAADFVVNTIPGDTTINPGNSTDFVVLFDPSEEGLRSATISIANSDPGKDPYNFDIQGTGGVVPDDDDGGGCALSAAPGSPAAAAGWYVPFAVLFMLLGGCRVMNRRQES